GTVQYRMKTMPAADALKLLRLSPYIFREKEGLSVINGTSMMSGIASLICFEVERIIILAVRFGAFALELAHGFNDSTSEKLHRLRPHRGQLVIARSLRDILASSHMRRSRRHMKVVNGENGEVSEQVEKISETVQEIYSFRCIPQILGPLFDAWERATRIVEIEINAVSDNPIVDWENKSFIHGGNFHGDYIGYAVDQLKIPLVKLSLMSERRINFFLNSNVNKFFPPFMNLAKPGLTLGLQGLQFVATSTAAQNQTYAFPHSVHSISTNADNQDVVSMGTDAALFAWNIVENTYIILAIELITLAQAVDFFGAEQKLSASSQIMYADIRHVCKKIENDRVLTDDVQNVAQFIRNHFTLDKSWLKL
ncbi:MAG: aromatic amino acid ammonia-lyase, partial [Patescibacteria group bacterium]